MAGGRPPKFKTVEELEDMVREYFQSLEQKDDEGRIYYLPATITGLALVLGFCSRQSLYDYEKIEEFSYIIKESRLMVENGYEKSLFSKHSTGAIFALKNMGWKDKSEVESVNHNVELELSEEEKQKAVDRVTNGLREFEDYE